MNRQNGVFNEDHYEESVTRFVREEAGQDLIEYALLAGLISLVCVVAITSAGTKVSTLFDNVEAAIPLVNGAGRMMLPGASTFTHVRRCHDDLYLPGSSARKPART